MKLRKYILETSENMSRKIPQSVFEKVKSEYSKYGIDEKASVAHLQEDLLNACYNLATTKNSFIKCIDEGAKMVRNKIQQLRKTTFAERITEPVTDEIVEELINELNVIKAPDGTGLGDIKRKLILACANVSKTVDDLLTCVDEGEKIPLIINKDLAKLI